VPETTPIQATVQAGRMPSTVASLASDLRALGVSAGGLVITHTAMSRLGYVIGGAQAVVEALLEVLGPEGTLVMPAFSGDRGDPAPWQHPPVPEAWWPLFREAMPAFDPRTTPSRYVSAVAETFRTWPGALRSSHPSTSFAARGPLAEALVASHGLENGLGETSPLARLYAHDAFVLLLGVSHAHNSSLHLAEHRAHGIRLAPIEEGAPLMVDGERRWVRYRDLDGDSDDFGPLGEAFAEQGGSERRGAVGLGTARLCRQRAIVDFGVTWLEAHRPS
jgi:aminoglycoside 3-N-acetyltransferase